MKKSFEIDMTNGPLLRKILTFSLPLILSSILQLLFNAADVVVVGRFSGSHALAAVGATTSLTTLFVNIFIGLSVGCNVIVAQYYGAKDDKGVQETVHTAILLSILSGFGLVIAGFFFAYPMLSFMGTPPEIIDQSALYMRIFFAGMPASMLYNFGAAMLRAVGDTKRPLYFLIIAGIINVCLNLIFVIVFSMGVAGVALATVISQVFSAGLILRCFFKANGVYRVSLQNLHIVPQKLLRILAVGLPAGIQSSLFSVSNVLIQSSVNSFGATVMAGNAAAANIEGFVYVAMNAYYHASLTFTSQNVGAGKYRRIGKILRICMCLVIGVGILFGCGAYLSGRQLLGIYSTDPEVIRYGLVRMLFLCTPYFICGIMDVLSGCIRGMGYSILPTMVSLTGACIFRIIWIFTVFAWQHTLFALYISYPISWGLTALVHFFCYIYARRTRFSNNKVVTTE